MKTMKILGHIKGIEKVNVNPWDNETGVGALTITSLKKGYYTGGYALSADRNIVIISGILSLYVMTPIGEISTLNNPGLCRVQKNQAFMIEAKEDAVFMEYTNDNGGYPTSEPYERYIDIVERENKAKEMSKMLI